MPNTKNRKTRSRRSLPAATAALAGGGWLTLATHAAPPAGGTWGLVFADEFNGTTLDPMKWDYNYAWGHTHNHRAYMAEEQVTVADGRLSLKAEQRRHPDAPASVTHGGSRYPLDYTSGAINTAGTFRVQHGYIEAKLKMPSAVGSWPAFWTLQNGWPPEIDIMEYPIADHDTANNDLFRHWVNYHYDAGAGHRSYGTEVWGPNLSAADHTYGVEWSPDFVKFYFDGALKFSVTDKAAVADLTGSHYLILNYAVGGWPGNPPSWPAGGQTFEADWVRVYKGFPTARATTAWKTGGRAEWTNWNNWTSGEPYFENQDAVFPTVAGAAAANPDWALNKIVGSVAFSGSTSYTLGFGDDDSLQLANSAGVAVVSVASGGTGRHRFDSRVELYSNVSVRNDSAAVLTFDGDVIGGGQFGLDRGKVVVNGTAAYTGGTVVSPAAEVTFDAPVTRTAHMNVDGGRAALNADNTYVADTLVNNNGRLVIGGRVYAADVSYPSFINLNVFNGGRVEMASLDAQGSLGYLPTGADRIVLDHGALALTGRTDTTRGFTVRAGGATIEALAGASVVLRDGSPAEAILSTAGGTLTLAGAGSGALHKSLGGTGGLVKDDGGSWTLAGFNTYSGQTDVRAGALTLVGRIGAGAVQVRDGAMLAGPGTLAGSLSVEAGGTLAPGAGLGTLSVAKEVFLSGTLVAELDPTGAGDADLLSVGATLDIAPSSVLDLQTLGPIDDAAYVIASYASLTGVWTSDNVRNLPGGYVIDYAFGDAGRQIAVVAVPEPGAAAAAAVMLGATLACRPAAKRRARAATTREHL